MFHLSNTRLCGWLVTPPILLNLLHYFFSASFNILFSHVKICSFYIHLQYGRSKHTYMDIDMYARAHTASFCDLTHYYHFFPYCYYIVKRVFTFLLSPLLLLLLIFVLISLLLLLLLKWNYERVLLCLARIKWVHLTSLFIIIIYTCATLFYASVCDSNK